MAKKRRPRRMVQHDPTEIPFYPLSTAARWVGVPRSTLYKWVHGRDYEAGGETRFSKPLIVAADPARSLLSFANIAEAHILAATRGHRISLDDLRVAIDRVQEMDTSERHPLLSGKIYRRRRTLFVDYVREKIAASSPIEGQRFLEKFDARLERLEMSRTGHIRLFPVRRNEKKTVVLNSDVAGGQPIIAKRGILVEDIQDLRESGLSVKKIAKQFGLREKTIAEALRYIA